ncbi:MAG TPA: hypothetical protein VK966_12635 [Longimicrobiales bacterium]|nr:hypothetical protein [Longimicrobiales bacterium]
MKYRGIGALALAAVLGACAGAAPARADAGEPGAGPAGSGQAGDPERVYVTGQDDATVTVIDAATHQVLEVVDLQAMGYSANAKPHHIVVDPDGAHWYVSLIGENRVLKLDTANRVVGEAAFEVPGMLVYDHASDWLYVGRSMSAVNPPRRIGIIDRSTMETVEELEVLYPRPHPLAAHPTAGLVYSSSLAANQMAVVDPAEQDVRVLPLTGGEEAATPGQPEDGMVHTMVQFAVSPDGRSMVGTGEMSGRLLVYDLADPASPVLVEDLGVGSRPWHPAYSPDGTEVWVPNKGSNSITVVETDGWTVVEEIQSDGLSEPHGLAFSADGRWAFVSSNDLAGAIPGDGGAVAVIDAETREVVKVIPVGPNATGIGTNARP